MTSTVERKPSVPSERKRRRLVWPRKRTPAEPQTVVVIGNGMAGYKLCEKLVSLNEKERFRIVVFGEEPHPAYDRVHLTSYLKDASVGDLLLADAEWYRAHGIELHLGDPAEAIDRVERVVRSASGKEVRYDRLVFATGSRAYVPSFPGVDLPGVFVYRTVSDLEAIRSHAAGSRRAAVLGGGLLGVEAAKALQDLGLETWIVERGASLLARQLDPEAGAVLQSHVEKLGVKICVQRETRRIEAMGDDRLVRFNTGGSLRVQLVVVAVGIRPRDELAIECGLEPGPRGGIRVDDQLRSSDPNIYAIGECASHRGTVYGLAAPGSQMADLLAENLAGKRRVYEGSDQSTRLKLTGIEVATLGDFQANGDDTLRWKGSEGCRRLVLEKGRLVGATSIGEWPEIPRVQELVERRGRIWGWRRQRFSSTGRLWKGDAALQVAGWPADALVCNCVGVRRGALSAACADGCSSVELLARRTGASTVCGSCKPLLAQLVGAPAWAVGLPGLKVLAVASFLAVLAVTAILLGPPVTAPDTVQSVLWKIDLLWRDAFLKQVTGFTLLGLALVSLVLSVRKRIRRFSLGEFGHWRAVHAVLGVFSLLALVTHTGFRLGSNVNLVLMLNFISLAAAGALAGGVTALERRLPPIAGKRLRSIWTGFHIAMAWPLPVLVGLHVAIAYYF